MPTLWQWVCKSKHSSFCCLFIIVFIVLHPGKKLLHFQKYWKKPETEDVVKLIQQKVRSFMIKIVNITYLI
jgi:hypothetical protein